MKIKIYEENQDVFLEKEDLNCEKTVYAVYREGKYFYYLVTNCYGLPIFIQGNNDREVTDTHIPEDWVYTKKFVKKYSYPQEPVIILLRDLFCPKWMLENENKDFFYEVYFDRDAAYEKFKKYNS